MSRLTDLRDAAVVRLAELGGATRLFKSVDKHVGRYTVGDLKRLLGASPACAVGIVNLSKPLRRASGEIALEVTIAAVIVTRSRRREEADDDALDLAAQVIASINAWVPAQIVPRVNPAADLHAEGVGDDELDREQMVVWAVIWTHHLVLGVDEIGAGIDPEHPLAGDAPALTVRHPARGDEEVA